MDYAAAPSPFLRSSAFMTGTNSISACSPTNSGSAIPGMSEASRMTKKIGRSDAPLCHEIGCLRLEVSHRGFHQLREGAVLDRAVPEFGRESPSTAYASVEASLAVGHTGTPSARAVLLPRMLHLRKAEYLPPRRPQRADRALCEDLRAADAPVMLRPDRFTPDTETTGFDYQPAGTRFGAGSADWEQA